MKTCSTKFFLWTWEHHCDHKVFMSEKQVPDSDHNGVIEKNVFSVRCCRCNRVKQVDGESY